jgi:hypothetical protein
LESSLLAGTPTVLERLRALLHEEGGLIATLVGAESLDAGAEGGGERAELDSAERTGEPHGDGDGDCADSPARIAASGPRTEDRAEQYELLVEAIYEGYLLHYGAPRVVRAADADLRVLAGDRLYAIGLARLVELGDTRAVAELADTITLSSLAQGARDAALADAVWAAGARAVGWGPSAVHARAKELVAGGSPQAFEAMRTSALGAAATP